MSKYNPESYWSKVAQRVKIRSHKNVVAGDDSPYYRYKRSKFINMLMDFDWNDKTVLELGSGPGGNLKQLLETKAKSLNGVDISSEMIELAEANINDTRVGLTKINGTEIPFADESFDVVFSSTVLQHNTDEEMMKKILKEMCRVSGDSVILFERIESKIKGDDLCKGRPVHNYVEICKSMGFNLVEKSFINIQTSFLVSGAIRKLFNSRKRVEGEQLSKFSVFLQKLTLPITKPLDNIFKVDRDLGKLVFKRD